MNTVRWILAALLIPSILVWTAAAADGQGKQGGSGSSNKGGSGQADGTPGKGNSASPTQGNTGPQKAGAPDDAGAPAEPGKPDLPVAGIGNGTSADVRRLVLEFREQQKQRLEEYRKLAALTRNAGAERREQLRAQLRQMLEEQKAERDRLREQIRERAQELTATLPTRTEVIDAAKEKARERQDRGRGE